MTTDTIGVVFLSSVVLVLVVSAGRSGPQVGGEELVGRFASGAPTMPVSSEPTDTPVVDAAWIRREARELQRVMTHSGKNKTSHQEISPASFHIFAKSSMKDNASEHTVSAFTTNLEPSAMFSGVVDTTRYKNTVMDGNMGSNITDDESCNEP